MELLFQRDIIKFDNISFRNKDHAYQTMKRNMPEKEHIYVKERQEDELIPGTYDYKGSYSITPIHDQNTYYENISTNNPHLQYNFNHQYPIQAIPIIQNNMSTHPQNQAVRQRRLAISPQNPEITPTQIHSQPVPQTVRINHLEDAKSKVNNYMDMGGSHTSQIYSPLPHEHTPMNMVSIPPIDINKYPDITTMVNSNSDIIVPLVESTFVDHNACGICGKRIIRDMSRHMRTHQAESRFTCAFPRNDCRHRTGKFNRPYDFKKHLLNRHFKFDNGEIKRLHNLSDKLHHWGTCPCGVRFLGIDWLDEHILTEDTVLRCPCIG